MSSTGYVTRFSLSSSRYLLIQHLLLHSICFGIVLMTPLALAAKLLLLAAFPTGFCIGLPALLNPPICRFILRRDGRFAAYSRSGEEMGWLEPQRCRQLITISLKGRYDSGRKFRLTLAPDMAGFDDRRKLRMWLSWQQS